MVTWLPCLAVFFAVPTAAMYPATHRHKQHKDEPTHQMRVLTSVPMHVHKDQCVRGPHKGIMAANQMQQILSSGRDAIPGAGLEKPEPFEKVFKDGFFEAACVKDYMWDKGDKFGMNAGTYDVEDSMNVSIVHYKDQPIPLEPMTREICFNFCRTIPDMKFFGLIYGRDCYCSPFFKQEAGDSSGCDAVCEGNPTEMCGGMAKSNIFAMHLCANTAEELGNAIEKAGELAKAAAGVGEEGEKTAKDLETTATDLMNTFGSAGDPVASNLMKTAIVFTGEFEKKAKKTQKLGKKLDELKSKAADLEGKDMTEFDTVQKAEATIADIDKTSEELEKSLEGTIDAFGKVMGEKIALEHNVEEEKLELKEEEEGEEKKEDEGEKKEPPSPLKLFLPVMHFVDIDASDYPSTCGGDLLGNPLALDAEGCALSCQQEGNKCAGFSFFFTEKTTICFLFQKLKSVTYYTKCGKFLQLNAAPRSFLQLSNSTKSKSTHAKKVLKHAEQVLKHAEKETDVPSPFALELRKKRNTVAAAWAAERQRHRQSAEKKGSTSKKAPEDTMCYAKFSMFSGTTLKPDPSGKCKLCLKTADKAQRCFE